ncbi:MAG: dihydropteroate synthase [Candidatus Omnitrophica bacterium CG_4_9_14_0_2_um_filter_42_8]|nr:MAG: dihydropteroate synthase [Candidatus Omnitrophica bacterium CG22_combo_CG10-13_8_21_14_all_43_16]PJC47391.1 MAG: dihydropteroate synthase [Candidatus Omnitrophica bacterium CG_4_9_14_0_2_um_filter_42_8]
MIDFKFGVRTYIMGVLNVTPDSFSGDGVYQDADKAVEAALKMVEDGADIIDIGGESTRPGAEPVTTEEEIKRVILVIKKLSKRISAPISIDTAKSEVAKQALDNGALIVNDITGLESDPGMIGIIREFNANVVVMHIKGTPQTMQKNPSYGNLIEEIKDKLKNIIEKAVKGGIKKENIIVDPGIGFGKTLEHNLEILNRLSEFKELKQPVLVGPSRKSFIGKLTGEEPCGRIFGTAASVALAIKNGADIIRVHDVKEMKQVAVVSDAISRSGDK